MVVFDLSLRFCVASKKKIFFLNFVQFSLVAPSRIISSVYNCCETSNYFAISAVSCNRIPHLTCVTSSRCTLILKSNKYIFVVSSESWFSSICRYDHVNVVLHAPVDSYAVSYTPHHSIVNVASFEPRLIARFSDFEFLIF